MQKYNLQKKKHPSKKKPKKILQEIHNSIRTNLKVSTQAKKYVENSHII